MVTGNPVTTRLEGGVGNCFPGLEFDHRNLDRVAAQEGIKLSSLGVSKATAFNQMTDKLNAIRIVERRTLGQWRGRVRMSDDFDAPRFDDERAAWWSGRAT